MNLRVLLIMDPLIPVPPVHYGGIERVIADLANGLSSRGHTVTLWAGPGSAITGQVKVFGKTGEWTRWSNIRNTGLITSRLLRQRHQFDLIHNFGRLAYLTAILAADQPKVQTYMRKVNPRNMRKVSALGGKRIHYTAVSAAIRDTGLPGGGEWSVIYNCAPIEQFTFNAKVDATTAPLVFLGRLDRCKGVHSAIEVAHRSRRRLLIAGNISELPHERDYFHNEVQPKIDGELIKYVGPVNNEQKGELLANGAALLTPIEFEEPFPIVLPEALACGTPVISFRRGGMPEGIEHGRTGFLCDDVAGMVEAVSRLGEIDRANCRAEAERRFSDEVIVSEYERLYLRLLRDGHRNP
ncbi:MAG: glycosyltransferase family 4 protein [Bryobacteraceae bacterium]